MSVGGMSVGRVAACLLLVLIAACAKAPPGGLEVEGKSLQFEVGQGKAAPAPQSLRVRVEGPGAQRIGAGFKAGETADWLEPQIEGNPPDLKLVVTITDTTLAPGDYSAWLEVATGDAQENILQSREVEVRYRVLGNP